MAVFERNGNYYFEFVYDGQRIRESAKTTRKTIAIEAEKQKRLSLEKTRNGVPTEDVSGLRLRTVKMALADYQKTYAVNHRAKSVAAVKERSPHLVRLLGDLRMRDLTNDRIVAYMAQRKKDKPPASGRTINMELAILARSLGSKFSLLWPKVKALEENHDVGRALEAHEEKAILDAATKNRSKLIHPFLYLLAWTGVRSDEARTMRWSQVNLSTNEVVVGKAKTEKGKGRHIPMTANLKAVLEQHAAVYTKKLGAIKPDYFVFPFCNRFALKDPTRPVTTLKSAWESVRTAAKVTCRLHDLRHSFCTKMAEAGVPESTMLDLMGHMSAAMLRRYSHIRRQARRDAIDAVELLQSKVVVPPKVPPTGVSSKPN